MLDSVLELIQWNCVFCRFGRVKITLWPRILECKDLVIEIFGLLQYWRGTVNTCGRSNRKVSILSTRFGILKTIVCDFILDA